MPQDGHWLASFEVISPPPPQKKRIRFFAPPKKDILKGGCARTFTFERILDTQKEILFFGYFFRKFCHADLDSREQQAILLKEVAKI